jgi:hypothetical protein
VGSALRRVRVPRGRELVVSSSRLRAVLGTGARYGGSGGGSRLNRRRAQHASERLVGRAKREPVAPLECLASRRTRLDARAGIRRATAASPGAPARAVRGRGDGRPVRTVCRSSARRVRTAGHRRYAKHYAVCTYARSLPVGRMRTEPARAVRRASDRLRRRIDARWDDREITPIGARRQGGFPSTPRGGSARRHHRSSHAIGRVRTGNDRRVARCRRSTNGACVEQKSVSPPAARETRWGPFFARTQRRKEPRVQVRPLSAGGGIRSVSWRSTADAGSAGIDASTRR